MNTVEAFEAEGAWGVQIVFPERHPGDKRVSTSTVYEAMFTEKVARRLAELEATDNPPDYETAKELMLQEGFIEADFKDPNDR